MSYGMELSSHFIQRIRAATEREGNIKGPSVHQRVDKLYDDD
jgi:hypothetical protein